MGILDFIRYRNGMTVTIHYIDTGEKAAFTIGRDIDREDVIDRIDRKTGEIYAVNYYDTDGEALTQLISPEDREFWQGL